MSDRFMVDLEDGSTFLSEKRIDPDWAPYANHDEGTIREMVTELWGMAVRARRGWTARWKRNELYYQGNHWENARTRRTSSTTNLCYQYVDATWAILTDGRPRPEVVPASGMKAAMADGLNQFAKWMMSANNFDPELSDGILGTAKYGTSPYLYVFDQYGICWPKSFSTFHYYPDPAAQNDEELEWFFIARPWSTRRLRALYPGFDIRPDNLVSPEYDAIERPLIEEAGDFSGRYSSMGEHLIGPASAVGIPNPPGSGAFVEGMTSGPEWLETTFLLELHIRDHTTAWTTYMGETRRFDPDENAFITTNPAASIRRAELVCQSGWRVIPMTANKTLLPDFAVDACFGGPAIEVQRWRRNKTSYWGKSLLDDTVPINRDFNQSLTMLKRGLAFATIPTLRVDKNAGTDLDEAPLEPGDIVKATPGSTVESLGISAPNAGLFEFINMLRMNGGNISSVQDAMLGKQPGSAETGVAIRELQQAGEARVRANENPLFFTMKNLLKRCMIATGKKINRAIVFKAADGRIISIDPEALQHEYDVTFTAGSGTAPGRRQLADQALAFAAQGVVDGQAVLEASDFPNAGLVMQRMAMAQQQAAARGKGGGKDSEGGE